MTIERIEKNMKKEIKRFFKENYKLIIATFIIGFLVHCFVLTNEVLTYDEIDKLFKMFVSVIKSFINTIVLFVYTQISSPLRITPVSSFKTIQIKTI